MINNSKLSVPNGTAEVNMRIAVFGQVKKYGNTTIVTIPKDVKTALEIEKGDYVWIEIWKVDPNEKP